MTIHARQGKGATIAFGTSAFAANVTSISLPSISRDKIDTTHLGTTAESGGEVWITKIPNLLIDGGQLSMDIQLDPDTAIPMTGTAVETVTFTAPKAAGQTTAGTWAFSGFISGYKPTVPYDGLMTATVDVEVCGKITVTAGS